ncbi:fatty acid desaturase [Variovorax ureilyticus]|uniref:Fatty acid desaturase n=1 Tax=Variovorax ureilyticus TaxID=1836198 RepID=A0ABU8VMM5_9BURK
MSDHRTDPRALMALRLPRAMQPVLTWLTGRPAPGERVRVRAPWTFLLEALAWTVLGQLVGAVGFATHGLISAALIALSLVLTTAGVSLFQIAVFHRCAHAQLFADRRHNRDVGRLVSALLLFKHFDRYQQEHMSHHSVRTLLTEGDEFNDFVLGFCRLEPGMPKRQLWRCVLTSLASPRFHTRFLVHRARMSWMSGDRLHDTVGITSWALGAAGCAAAGWLIPFFVLWVLPLTLLLQLVTVGRILIEHRFPDPSHSGDRDKLFQCRVTLGVFPGSEPPPHDAATLRGLVSWVTWWADMLTVQLLVRVVVLVADTPCHDFHHRRPSSPRWTEYAHARQDDLDAGCPGYPINYGETWGLIRAIDENLAALSSLPRDASAGR